ncbi:hypothetical protein PHLGIDRAFT_136252 [Phlebiopsis gigantea 11061_1 CR5-6]|uniref:Uncharacterized protein n=1 Tax=Phlebiopsis gigantea (strain 11061_1 CR5-6) TaxID=745531 RepID=A0A0C3PXH5_PHLG1|nr:hypothetical protein PHLGIDRAFT_136252 [Phlebiopsis gigantea 11061_1 CR5-6]
MHEQRSRQMPQGTTMLWSTSMAQYTGRSCHGYVSLVAWYPQDCPCNHIEATTGTRSTRSSGRQAEPRPWSRSVPAVDQAQHDVRGAQHVARRAAPRSPDYTPCLAREEKERAREDNVQEPQCVKGRIGTRHGESSRGCARRLTDDCCEP